MVWGCLLLYFVNSQSVHFLPFVVRVSEHNGMIRIFLRDAETHMESGISVFVRCCSIIFAASISWAWVWTWTWTSSYMDIARFVNNRLAVVTIITGIFQRVALTLVKVLLLQSSETVWFKPAYRHDRPKTGIGYTLQYRFFPAKMLSYVHLIVIVSNVQQ